MITVSAPESPCACLSSLLWLFLSFDVSDCADCPSFEDLPFFCKDVADFLSEDEKNVVVIRRTHADSSGSRRECGWRLS